MITPSDVAGNAAPSGYLTMVDGIDYNNYSYAGPATPVALDGAGHAWTVNQNSDTNNYSYLFEINNADTAFLSPMNSSTNRPWGFTGWDNSSEYPDPLGANTAPLAVDNAGNLWIANSSKLSEFIGIAIPAHTPLVSGLVNGNLPGTRP